MFSATPEKGFSSADTPVSTELNNLCKPEYPKEIKHKPEN